MQIRPAQPDEMRDVLRLSLSAPHRRPSEVAAQVENFLAYARALSLDLSRQWVVADGSRRVAGCTCLDAAGRLTLLLLPAELPPGVGAEPARALVREVIRSESQRGSRILQCLFEPREGPLVSGWLGALGFVHLARLCYMESTVAGRPVDRVAGVGRGMTWIQYDDSIRADFVATVAESYVDSLDCPGLTRLRSASDAMESHRAAGIFRPQRWFLLCLDGRAAGCLLLNETPTRPMLEIVYMGVAPWARRRGAGRALLERAVSTASYDGFTGISLAVDANNAPARRLYGQFGFRVILERDAWILALSDAAEG